MTDPFSPSIAAMTELSRAYEAAARRAVLMPLVACGLRRLGQEVREGRRVLMKHRRGWTAPRAAAAPSSRPPARPTGIPWGLLGLVEREDRLHSTMALAAGPASLRDPYAGGALRVMARACLRRADTLRHLAPEPVAP